MLESGTMQILEEVLLGNKEVGATIIVQQAYTLMMEGKIIEFCE